MRLAALAVLVATTASAPGWAACTSHPMSDSAQSYTSALLKRLRPLGVKGIDRVGPSGSGDHYAVLGAQRL